MAAAKKHHIIKEWAFVSVCLFYVHLYIHVLVSPSDPWKRGTKELLLHLLQRKMTLKGNENIMAGFGLVIAKL